MTAVSFTTPTDPDVALEALVATEYDNLRARAEARRRFAAEQDPNRDRPLDAGLLGDVLARPHDEPWRVERVLPAGGRLLLSAQRKVGKTTAVGNLCRALLAGEPFLGRFEVRKLTGNVVFLNYEVTARQCARWMDEIGVPRDRLLLVTLRGHRNMLADDDGRAQLVELIRRHDGQVLVVDPFGRAYSGASQNDAGEVQAWLVGLDELAEQAGCAEVVLTAHAGWDGERTRGSSALEDWPDAIVTMTKDAGVRYLRAEGRDVDIDEDRLDYDPVTRRLSLSGAGNRAQASARAIDDKIAQLLEDEPDLSGREIESRLIGDGTGRDKLREALRNGVSLGWIETSAGPNRATLHRLSEAGARVRGIVLAHSRSSGVPRPIEGAPPAPLANTENGRVPPAHPRNGVDLGHAVPAMTDEQQALIDGLTKGAQ